MKLLALALTLGTCCAWGQLPEAVVKRMQRSASYGFRPAVYEGIRMGVSKRAEVVARFGKPEDEGLGEDGALYLSYQNIGVYKGRSQFILDPRSKVVWALDVTPIETSFEELEKRYGKNWVRTRWSMPWCSSYEKPQPSFISPDRGTEKIEFRQLGISVDRVGDRADEVRYESRPLGVDTDPCPARREENQDQSARR